MCKLLYTLKKWVVDFFRIDYHDDCCKSVSERREELKAPTKKKSDYCDEMPAQKKKKPAQEAAPKKRGRPKKTMYA